MAAALGIAAGVAAAAAVLPGPVESNARVVTADTSPVTERGTRKPNVVFFLTDDMPVSHLAHMPRTRRLIFARGARFTNYHTSISLCCPSRASMFTGKYAHNTGITGNGYPDGFYGFHTGDERRRTFALALKRQADYRTGLLGKYLNEYPFVNSAPRHGVRPTFVPNGWSEWAVPVRGQYYGTDYELNLNGRMVHKSGPRNYLGDFLTRRAVGQIERNRDDRGLALMLSFYGPHEPAPTSPVEMRNRALLRRVSDIRYPRTPDFNERNVRDKPSHIRRRARLGPRAVARIDRAYRRQILSVTSIDRHVGTVVRALRRTGQLDNTFLVFTSDHGYHMGSHRLPAGKNSAYAIDVRVPFAIRGPGIEPGSVVREVTGNIDVAPTFAAMAGVELPYLHDGESLLPLARGQSPQWRNHYLVATGQPYGGRARTVVEGPQVWERAGSSSSPGARGVVGRRFSYVRYHDGQEELYDARTDPYQLRNILARRPADRTEVEQAAYEDARQALRQLTGCAGVEACRVQ